MVLEQFKTGSALELKIRKIEEYFGADVDSIANADPAEFDPAKAFELGTLGLGTKAKTAGKVFKGVTKKLGLEEAAEQAGKKLMLKVDKAVEKYTKNTADVLSKKYKTAGDINIRVGSKGGVGVSQKFKPNAKNMTLMEKIGKKVFSGKTLAYLGGAGGVGSIILSLWARTEAIDIVEFVAMKPAYDLGIFQEDWSLHEEAKLVRNEIINQTTFQKINNFLPISGPIQNMYGEGGKIQAAIDAFRIQDEVAAKVQSYQNIDEERLQEMQNMNKRERLTEALRTEEDASTRVYLERELENLDLLEAGQKAEEGGMRGIMQTGEEDPERRAAVMLEASAAKEREEAERERRRNQRTTSGTGRPTRTEGSESPRPQARSKLGFGI